MITLLLACRTVLTPGGSPSVGDVTEDWASLLAEVVSDDGYVDYEALASRRGPLDAYVLSLGKDRPRVDRENTQHHLWLNAYNALAMYSVLEAGRPGSVDDVPGWLPWQGAGFFVERAFVVQGQAVSLSEILHERLRGRVMDHRDHAAVIAPFRSSPPARRELYRLGDLDGQLRDQMGGWVDDDQRGVRIEDGKAVFSALFQRFAFDFDHFSAGEDLCTMTARFASGAKAAKLLALGGQGCPHEFMAFDRSLNDVHGRGDRATAP